MADNPILTPEEIKPVEENLTWAGVTVPTPVIDQPVIETPVVTEPVTQETPIVETPIIETPIIETPQVTEPVVIPEVKVDTPKVEIPKATKVETVQDIETKTIQNESADVKLQEEKRNKTIAEATALVQNGATIDEIVKFGANNPDNRDAINSTLKGAFKNASNLEFFGKYSTMSNDDMFSAYTLWEVTPWSDRYNLLPPEKKASFDAFLKQKEAANITEKTDYTASNNATDFTSLQSEVPKMFNSTVRENYQKALNSPKLLELNEKAANKQLELDKLDIEMETLQEDMEKQLAGNLTWSIRAEVRQSYNEKIREKRLKLAEYNSFASQINSIKSQAETELKLSQYEDGIAREEYQTALGLYETRRKEKRADVAADADTANKIEAAAFKRQEDIEDMLFVEQNKQIATEKGLQNDKVLAQYKHDLAQGVISGKWEDRFDWMYFLDDKGAATKVIDWGVTTDKDWTKTYTSLDDKGNPIFQIYDINWTAIWANTNVSKLNQQEADLLNTPAGSIIPTRLKTVSDTNTNRGKECAEYMNDIFSKTTGQRMWDSYASKLAVANEQTGTLGSMAVWQPNPWNPSFAKFWHAGVIVWESEDGKSWHIKSSNIKWDWVISVDEVPKDVIAGYKSTNIYDTPIEDKEYSVAQTEFLKTIDVTSGTNKEMKATIANLWLTEEDVFAFKSQDVPKETTAQFETLLQRLGNLKGKDWTFTTAEWFNEVVWFWLQKVFDIWEQNFIAGTDAANFAADLDTFLANITIDNLDKMTWVLTDKDLEILKGAGTALSSNLSEEQFVERITELEKVYKKALWQDVIETADVVFTDTDKNSSTFWVEFSNETLKKELLRQIELNENNPNEWATSEEVKVWLKQKNITLK